MAIVGVQILCFGIFWLSCSSLWFAFGHFTLGYIFVALGLTMLIIGVARLRYDLRPRLVIDLDRQLVDFIGEDQLANPANIIIIPPR